MREAEEEAKRKYDLKSAAMLKAHKESIERNRIKREEEAER